MGWNFICGSDTYTLGKDTVALPVDIENLPENIEVEGNLLLRKTSFHISLVCIGRMVEKYGIDIPDFVDKVVNDFCNFVGENEVSLTGYLDEFRFAEEGERKSVVAMCEVTNLNPFFDFLNTKYGLSLELQPTHVSLFTLQQDKAIFLIDSDDLNRLTRIIPKPVGVSLLKN